MVSSEQSYASVVDEMKSLIDVRGLANTLRHLAAEPLPRVNLDWHIKQWAKNKAHLFKLFGNKLTVEKEVETTISNSRARSLIDEFINDNLRNRKEYSLIQYFFDKVSTSEIANNKTEGTREVFDMTFGPGMKITRIMAKLTQKEFVHEIQTKYSMLIQGFKVKGTAVISIDPLDYITMSTNNSGWRSCHAPDGEYRVGTLAYMIDVPTAIAYVKTGTDVHLSGFDTLAFSNKIWRQVVLFENSFVCAIQSRQYPSYNDNNANTVSNMLVELLQNQHPGKEYAPVERETYQLERLVQDAAYDDECLWYNDITHSSFDSGIVVKQKDLTYPECISECSTIEVGAPVLCVSGFDNWLQHPAYYSYSNYVEDNSNDYDDDDYFYSEEDSI